jgi:thioredoxin 1
MNKLKSIIFVVLLVLAVPVSSPGGDVLAESETIPVKGMVTLVDLGAGSCIPCKQMAPILEELKKEYAGRAAIIFIDVWQERDLAQRFAISMIPTQIFFDREGKEIYRHVGFMDKQTIVDRLEYLRGKK